MQRPQGISAHADNAPVEPDVGLRLSTALKRLAALRATIHSDWSDGPASLLEVANVDLPGTDALHWPEGAALVAGAPELWIAPAAVEEPMPLRGRFDDLADDTVAPCRVDVSWLDLIDENAQPLVPPAPDADMILDEIIVALAFAEDSEAVSAHPVDVADVAKPSLIEAVAPAETDIIEIDFIEPAFAIGAAPGVLELLHGPFVAAAPPTVREPSAATVLDDAGDVFAVGAFGIGALFGVVESATSAPVAAPVVASTETDDLDPLTFMAFGAAPDLLALDVIAPPTTAQVVAAVMGVVDDTDFDVSCAPFGVHALLTFAEPAAAQVILAPAPAAVEDEEAPALAVGAFALWFDATPEDLPIEVTASVNVDDDADVDLDIAFGAAPMLVALLDAVPAPDATPVAIRPFDPMSLVDDALADAFDALLCAPNPIDPLDEAWTPDAFATDTDHAANLAALESQLWALPRHVPCAETFLLTPNHEIAVRITRALRVRANALEARAFADTAAFGFLRSDTDAQAFWFLADALHDAASLSAGDADVDASFSDWRMNDDGLLVVTAPDNAHPKRPPPLISEAELDALFTHVDDAQSRVVLDDLGDDPTWNDTFWCDVDTYLEHVSETMDPAMIDHSEMHDDAFDIHDIEVRAMPVPMPPTTFFWMPGDDFGLAVEGDGADLFIVSASDAAAVILIEDGSSHAMRTGQTARMDEVVVSLSSDAWSYVDGMHWQRVATLSGIAQVRVEQNAALTRRAVIAGSFFATTLEDDGVRLVLSADDGDVDYPVIRVGGSVDGADWPFVAAKDSDAVFV